MTLRLAWVALAALGAACGFQPSLGGTSGPNDGSTSGGDDSGGGSAVHDDGGEGSDAGIVLTGRCSSPGALRDDFSTPAPGNGAGQWLVLGTSTTAFVSGGTLSVTPTSSSAYTGYFAKHDIDLTGSIISVEVPQMIAAAGATAGLYLFVDTTHYLSLYQQNGMLVAEYNTGGGITNQKTAYDATKRWWRIVEASGQITYEWSPDNTTWTPFGPALSTPTFVTSLGLGLLGVSFDNANHGTAMFDNLNQSADPAPWCKASAFSDHFARAITGADWKRRVTPTSGAGCTPLVNTGAKFDESGTASTRCYLATAKAFDLRDSSAMIDVVPPATPPPGWSVFLRGINDHLDAFFVQFQDQSKVCTQINASAPVCVDYVAGTTYYRVREASGQLYFETSATATAWTIVSQIATPFSMATIQLEIGTSTQASFSSGTVPLTVSAYNTTP